MTPQPAIEDTPQPLTYTQHQRRSSSPGNSPHKLGKVGPKRMRTVTPRDLTKSISESSLENWLSDTQSVGINLIGQPPVTTLTLSNFFENVNEHKKKQEELKENVLMYVFQKCSLYQHSN